MKIFITVLFIIIYHSGYTQNIFEKKTNENSEDFLSRIFPDVKFSQVLSGNWGDTTSRYKIIGFYADTVQPITKAVILQTISKNKFEQLNFDYEFGIGLSTSTSEITSVFFFDVNNDKLKELVILEKGTARCSFETEEFDEEQNKVVMRSMSALCESCGYTVFEQKLNSKSVTSIEHEEFTDNQNNECIAENIKKMIKQTK